jgi:uncharacterized membrane-anchored protein
MPTKQSDETKLAVLDTKLDNVIEKLNSVDQKVTAHYVSKEEFDPVKKIVYGLVTLILIAVVGALVALVVGAKP